MAAPGWLAGKRAAIVSTGCGGAGGGQISGVIRFTERGQTNGDGNTEQCFVADKQITIASIVGGSAKLCRVWWWGRSDSTLN
ncbi:UNVERIFIED_CONTAM: hypothetical protein Sangu_1200100 [Sesamum angustifolium]|uniref:Uncharacterized protein n=1 Tax=Sesamum angustifolium TaxID=2727405 RepID=A0AAW2NGK3_9LAMI